MSEVEYLVSTSTSKFHGYQSKKGNTGYVKAFIPSIWNGSNQDYDVFIMNLIYIIIHERVCLERGFQRIKIKGGMCKPCCVNNIAELMYKSTLDFFEKT